MFSTNQMAEFLNQLYLLDKMILQFYENWKLLKNIGVSMVKKGHDNSKNDNSAL